MSATPRYVALICCLAALSLFAGCGPENNTPDPDASTTLDTSGLDAGNDDSLPRPSLQIRAATFNVGRFFDTVCDSNNCGDSTDFERQMSDAEFTFKAEQIAGGLEKLDADIVTLQEIENETCLQALTQLRPEYTVAEFGEIGSTASLDVAILGRGLTHIETRRHRADTTFELIDGRTQRFAREFLEVHFDKDGRRIVVFAAHFKAQRNDDPEWRLGEATTAREIAEATQSEFPAAFVYIGGDLNDEPGSAPLDAMTTNGGLLSATRDLPETDIWTYAYISNRIAIDHLLFVPRDRGEVIPGTAGVVRDASGAFAGSDHAALAANFNIWLD